MDFISHDGGNKYPAKSTNMSAKEFSDWMAKKKANHTWQGSDTPDAKYAKPDSPGSFKRPS